MSNGRMSRLRRSHEGMAKRIEVQVSVIEGLRGELCEATNDIDRLRGDLADVLWRVERIERHRSPEEYVSRWRR